MFIHQGGLSGLVTTLEGGREKRSRRITPASSLRQNIRENSGKGDLARSVPAEREEGNGLEEVRREKRAMGSTHGFQGDC